MPMHFEFQPTLTPPSPGDNSLSLYFLGDRLLLPARVQAPGGASAVLSAEEPWTPVRLDEDLERRVLGLGTLDGRSVRCVSLAEAPAGWQALGLREYLLVSTEARFRVVSAAAQLLDWARTQNFCSRCGRRLDFAGQDRALVCHGCGYRAYPRINPCVIVSVFRPGEVLLAQSLRMKASGLYSCLAGFIEAGENAEEAVHREVLEESGLQLQNLQYAGSQSWPFPHQLMLGFTAEWASGDLVFDTREIAHAAWFRPDVLPPLAPPQTIAYRLIRQALERCR